MLSDFKFHRHSPPVDKLLNSSNQCLKMYHYIYLLIHLYFYKCK